MKKGQHKVIRGGPLEDKIGPYVGFCTNPYHMGIVRYCQYKICEKRGCEWYAKLRPKDNKFTNLRATINSNNPQFVIKTEYRRYQSRNRGY